ncbi:hypothetical protein [uncultured Marivirga sp.]|uniref:carboxylesterase family protein n=1 Tax=uncultured Marivirga sp. TaxID=1123707 RepID=UPI0030EC7500|tara:strand:+ start:32118 stop:33296 length:1179 start_codon:yes stop_codon:yes gene_type:complete
MKKTHYLIILLLLPIFIFISCGKEDDVTPKDDDIEDNQDEEEEDPEPEIVLEWATDFPQLRVGIRSADFLLKTKSAVDVYYIFSNQELDFESAEDLRNLVDSEVTENILLSGKRSTSSQDDTLKVTLDGLAELTTFYAYSLISHPEKDSLQEEGFSIEFETQERQGTHSFQSEEEEREVLYLAYQLEEGLKYPEKLQPAIIFMGGNGETANQGAINLIRNGSLPQFLDKGNDVPMYVFSPQHIKNNWNIHMINEMVDEAIENCPIDPKRVYMTGISGGGFASWNYGVEYPERIAAMVPISGGGNSNKACELKDVPIWAFHNETDGIVGSNGSKSMVNAVNACPPEIEAELILFEDNGHNAWRRVYDQEHNDWNKTTVDPVNIYDWFLQFEKD